MKALEQLSPSELELPANIERLNRKLVGIIATYTAICGSTSCLTTLCGTKGYVSVGDSHTTRPLETGTRPEETRFFGLKPECGIHD